MATVQSAPNAPAGRLQPAPMTREEKKVIFASSLGTVFEWYDFYLYGSLAAIIAKCRAGNNTVDIATDLGPIFSSGNA